MQLSDEALERMDGLVNRRYIHDYFNGIEGIVDDLYQDGFEVDEIKAYLKHQIDEFVNVIVPTKS